MFLFAYPANKIANTDEEYSITVYFESFMYSYIYTYIYYIYTYILCIYIYIYTTTAVNGHFLDKVQGNFVYL